jgi:hypothetical protein
MGNGYPTGNVARQFGDLAFLTLRSQRLHDPLRRAQEVARPLVGHEPIAALRVLLRVHEFVAIAAHGGGIVGTQPNARGDRFELVADHTAGAAGRADLLGVGGAELTVLRERERQQLFASGGLFAIPALLERDGELGQHASGRGADFLVRLGGTRTHGGQTSLPGLVTPAARRTLSRSPGPRGAWRGG